MRILVSGAGIAGLACARELSTRGHDVTVVDCAESLRLTGTPIDIRGDAIGAVTQMGLLEAVTRRRIRMSEQTVFVDDGGEPVARMPMAEINDSEHDIELLRADLLCILADAVPDTVTVRFGDSLASLRQRDDGVDVRFVSGATGRYDLVIGADGQRSEVRRLTFGPDQLFERHLGVYLALAALPDGARYDGANVIYNVPGRMAGIFRYRDTTVAAFEFLSEQVDLSHREPAAAKEFLFAAFASHRSWRIPELLEAARADPGFYLTAASQIHMPSWHRGRVALVGDAGYCAAFLSGRGTSLALTGARLLAEELDRCADHSVAFARYESRQRPSVISAQSRVDSGRRRMLPATWADIDARNQALRDGAVQVP